MRKRSVEKAEIVEEGAPEWVVTFGDLMSLLLCFFVLLLSFSEMDREKYRVMSGSMANAFGVQKKQKVMEMPMGNKIIAKDFDQDTVAMSVRENLIKDIQYEVDNQLIGMKHLVALKVEKDSVTIQLMGETTFDSGSAQIRQQMIPVLKKIGALLMETTGDIVISGHTDNVPVKGGMYPSNLVLSMARAASVAEFILRETPVVPARVATMGYGEFRPIEPNDTPEGRRKNRRVEIKLSTASSQK
ncbi:flagellar motor protein MotB [Desulfococcus sp.]|uniref:flagellar motor protein MotB n=1 Tax=Desulfococcus sp. TaxID=2025834 RepID=UPI0035944EE4